MDFENESMGWEGHQSLLFWVLLCFCFCLLMEKSHDQTFLEHDLHLRGEVYSKKLGGQWGLAGGRSGTSSVEMNDFI